MSDTFLEPQEPLLSHEIPYQILVEQSLVGIYMIQDESLKYCNEAFAAITGHHPEQLINQPISTVVAPENLTLVLDKIRDRLNQPIGSSERYFLQSRHIEGHLVDLEVHGRNVMYEGRPAIAGVAVNMTQQLSYERELHESHRQLQLMGRYVNELREHHRQEIARELHDVLGGLLTSIKMSATRLLQRAHSKDIIEIAEDINTLAQNSINFARNTSEQLYPVTLSYLGLIPTLDNLLQDQHARSGLNYTLEVDKEWPELPLKTMLLIYRIVQESITNVLRHAQANQVIVRLKVINSYKEVQIEDDGIGLRIAQSQDNTLGLLFMKERASALGGELNVTNGPRGGALIQLRLCNNGVNGGDHHD